MNVAIDRAGPSDVTGLDGLAVHDGSFAARPFMAQAARARLWGMQLHGLSVEGGELYLASHGATKVGLVALSDMRWDTRVFGESFCQITHLVVDPEVEHPSAIVERLLRTAVEKARTRGARCVVVRANSDQAGLVRLFGKEHFSLVDTQILFARDMSIRFAEEPESAPGRSIDVRDAQPADLEDSVRLARVAFKGHFGRFHSDDHIAGARATEVYAEWVASSFEGYADRILLADVEGVVAGLSVWKHPSQAEIASGADIGHYSLGCVHPAFSGRGVFTELTRAGIDALQGRVQWLEASTHVSQIAIQHAFRKLCFQATQARYTFHRWLVPAGGP